MILLYNSVSGQEIYPLQYFPHSVGNSWTYYSYLYYDTTTREIVKDSTDIKGNLYIFYDFWNTPLHMVDSVNNNIYSIINNKPVLWYKLNSKPGEKYLTDVPGSQFEVRVDSMNATIFNEFLPVKVFTWYLIADSQSVPQHKQYLAYGLGPIRYVSTWTNSDDRLIGAVIDGKRYGTALKVKEDLKLFNNQYVLSQNCPNPFNSTTVITLTIPSTKNIDLSIYNNIGQKVCILYSGLQVQGTYKYTFNSNNFASGIYYYKVNIDSRRIIKKMILIR